MYGAIWHPKGPYTAHSRTLVPTTIPGMVSGTRVLRWALYATILIDSDAAGGGLLGLLPPPLPQVITMEVPKRTVGWAQRLYALYGVPKALLRAASLVCWPPHALQITITQGFKTEGSKAKAEQRFPSPN